MRHANGKLYVFVMLAADGYVWIRSLKNGKPFGPIRGIKATDLAPTQADDFGREPMAGQLDY